jgi:hypothetical protein
MPEFLKKDDNNWRQVVGTPNCFVSNLKKMEIEGQSIKYYINILYYIKFYYLILRYGVNFEQMICFILFQYRNGRSIA